jgi:hypothetical protein
MFGSHEKITKIQKLEFGKCCRNPATSGRRCRNPARNFDQIRPETSGQVISGRFGQIRPDQWPDRARAGRIPAILARSDWLSRNLAIFRPESDGRDPAPIGYRRLDVVRLRRRLDSDD